jgi:hypothetical protein
MTAWKDFFSKVVDAPDIYEFDLRQFFPSVSQSTIYDCLINHATPPEVANSFHAFNRSSPKIPKDPPLDEHDPLMFKEVSEAYETKPEFTEPLTEKSLVDFLVSKARSPRGLFSIGQALLGEDFSHVISVTDSELVLGLMDGGRAEIELTWTPRTEPLTYGVKYEE